jgi:uncharacterized protein
MDLERIRREAREFFRDARGSHDWEHTERVFRLCRHIAAAEGADMDVVLAAALLHDIGRAEEFRTNGRRCHAAEGAERARELLRHAGISEGEAEAVAGCVATHRFRGGNPPQTLEARVLYDADKLDSIGAVGIGRAFLFAGEVGATLHDPAVDPGATQPYSREDTAYREFLVKLRHVKDRMLTETGRAMAEERHRFMVGYFERLNQEVEGDL